MPRHHGPLIKYVLAGVILVASVMTPWFSQQRAQARTRQRQEVLAAQSARLAEIQASNRRLSETVAKSANDRSQATNRPAEIQRLQAELELLRQGTNEIRALRDANERLKDAASQRASEQAAQTLSNICLHLNDALRMYANDHTNKVPSSFAEIRKYFPALIGTEIGLHSFGFVSSSDVTPSRDVISLSPRSGVVLRESRGHQAPNGKQATYYGFPDGRIIEVVLEDGNFDKWEREHLDLAPHP